MALRQGAQKVVMQAGGNMYGARVRQIAATGYIDAHAALKEVMRTMIKRPDLPRYARSAFDDFAKNPRPIELVVTVCDDEYIAEENAEWRGVEEATDVLAFPSLQFGQFQVKEISEELLGTSGNSRGSEQFTAAFFRELDSKSDAWFENSEDAADMNQGDGTAKLGELVISLETADAQAKQRGVSIDEEIRILMAHGLLHLVGYDHERGPSDFEAMRVAEQELLASLGWKGQGLIDLSTDVENLNA